MTRQRGIIYLTYKKSDFSLVALEYYYRGDSGLYIYAKTFLELLDMTQVQLCIYPLAFIILSYLAHLTFLNDNIYLSLLVLGFTGLVGILLSPWLILYISAFFVFFKVFSDVIFLLTLIAMVFVTVLEVNS